MGRPKKEPTHDKYTIEGNKASKSESVGESDNVEITIPKGMPYVKVRKALEIALLRVR